MLNRPIDRLDIFNTGNYVAWFRGKIILPTYHFEFVIEDYIEPFTKKANSTFAAHGVSAKITRQDFYGNRQYRIIADDYTWIVENCPSPPRITLDIVLAEMEKHQNPTNENAYNEFKAFLKNDINF